MTTVAMSSRLLEELEDVDEDAEVAVEDEELATELVDDTDAVEVVEIEGEVEDDEVEFEPTGCSPARAV